MEQSMSYPNVQNDFLDFKVVSPQMNRASNMGLSGPNPYMVHHQQQQQQQQQQPSYEIVSHVQPQSANQMVEDTLNQLKSSVSKMMSMLERLEVRMNKVEQSTQQILKNQQEVLQVPFMSQTDLDQARQAAEQLERDSTVAKQLQAAFNKEVDVKKTSTSYRSSVSQGVTDCPICGAKVSNYELEGHVDKCLAMFSDDPKKQVQVKDTQKKVEAGFFSKMFKGAKTEKTETTTTTTKTFSTHATAPNHEAELSQNFNYFGGYPSYPVVANPQMGSPQMGHSQMVMPMYMYPSYPNTHMTTQLQDH